MTADTHREPTYAPADEQTSTHTVNCGCGFDAESPNADVIRDLLEAHNCPNVPRPTPTATTWHESLSYLLIVSVVVAGLVILFGGWPAPWN